jgi:putative transposase
MAYKCSPYPRRPPRLDLVCSKMRPFYFVIFNTYRRLPLLARPEIHEAVLLVLRSGQRARRGGRQVCAHAGSCASLCCVAHRRFASEMGQGTTLGDGKEIARSGIQKPHWQEGFFDHLLRSRESYSQKWNYVRMNPVRAGLSRTLEEWPYQGEIISLGFD